VPLVVVGLTRFIIFEAFELSSSTCEATFPKPLELEFVRLRPGFEDEKGVLGLEFGGANIGWEM